MTIDSMRQRSELLRSLTDTDLEVLGDLSREMRAAQDEILFDENGPADTLFIVVEGRVGLEMTSPGKSPLVIQTLGSGDLVGLSWYFPPYRWKWRARTLVDTDLIAFDAAGVRQHCDNDRDLALSVLGVLAQEMAGRLHGARVQLLDLYSKS